MWIAAQQLITVTIQIIAHTQPSHSETKPSILNLPSSILKSQSQSPFLNISVLSTFSCPNFHPVLAKMFSLISTITSLAIISITTITATPLPAPQSQSGPGELCETSRVYFPKGMCSNGFIGCGPPDPSNPKTCPGMGVFKLNFNKDCGAEAFNLGKFFECPKNGYYGCNTILNICDLKINSVPGYTAPPFPHPPPPAPPVAPPFPQPPTTKWSCPAGTNYFGEGVCPSGFLGCHQNGGEVCPGGKRFYNDCPSEMNFYRCSNGFVGCTTKPNMCGWFWRRDWREGVQFFSTS